MIKTTAITTTTISQGSIRKHYVTFFYELTSLTRDVIKTQPLIENLQVSKCITKRHLMGYASLFLPVMFLF